MKVIKKINNNVAVCIDKNGNELVAFGKGIGFPSIPYELDDIEKIDQTYYGVNHSYLNLLNNIPEPIFNISTKIVEWARTKLSNDLSINIVFTLADHINYAIKRYNEKIDVKMPFGYDIQHLYETEMMIGKKAVSYINRQLKIHLGSGEAVGIAMHFINSEQACAINNTSMDDEEIIDNIRKLIEDRLGKTINKDGFNYSRFVTHMQYLLKRKDTESTITSDNEKMFFTLKEEYPDAYLCATDINRYLEDHLNWSLNQEELLYLILHVNRLCSREDCNH